MWGAGDVIAYNSMCNILKTEAAQTKLLPAQTSTNDWACFGWIWSMWGAEWPQKKTIKYYFNILKTEAAQTIFFTAQTEHKQTRPFFREFGACGGLSDVIAYISMSNILKTKATQTKILTAQTSTKDWACFGWIWSMWGGWWRHRL